MNTKRVVKKRLRALPSVSRESSAAPFLKWAGGKSRLLNSYEPLFPAEFNRYFEPFTGGAAVFFHLRNTHGDFEALLSDQNFELINCYTVVRDQLELLLSDLKKHQNEESYFYDLRSLDPESLDPVERASRLIYLNKTCFNGLYRVNSKGAFNVPFGFYKNPNTCNESVLKASRQALQNTRLSCAPFDDILKKAKKGDFIYLDPPYHPLSSTSNFTSYTKNSFSAEDQERLADTVLTLHKRGCKIMLSNSDCPFIRDLYSDFRIETVYALRAINCKASGRGRISELVVLNY